jgi:hypothetical protein
MKKLLAIALSLSLLACQSQEKSSEVEEVKTDLPTGMFGEEITASGALSLTSLVASLEESEAFEGKIVGEIKEVCAMKGCWMTIDLPNGETMRVTFKDYGFFVPKNAHGFPVIIEGVASKKVIDVATLKHYAEDAGKSQEEINAINSPKVEYAFEAKGVIIQENA